jgi:hypothetical protein
MRITNVTGAFSVPGSNADTQYGPTATVEETCAVNEDVTGAELIMAPQVTVPSVFVVADVRPMPTWMVGRAGPVGVAVTLTRPRVAVPAAVTEKEGDVSVPPTGSVSVYKDVDVLTGVVVGDVVLELLLHPAATSAARHAMTRTAFMSAFLDCAPR